MQAVTGDAPDDVTLYNKYAHTQIMMYNVYSHQIRIRRPV